MINSLALILGALIVAELIALVGKRAWVHWRLGHRAVLVDDAITSLAEALVTGAVIARPQGRAARRAFRLAALELFPMLAGDSRRELTGIVENLGLVDHVIRTLERSPRAYARRTATDELAEIASERAVPALEQALGDRDRIVRITAVRALAALPRLDRIERMTQVLEQDSSAAPSSAISALLSLSSVAPEALAELERLSESPYVRRLTAIALARVGDQRAMPSLVAELASDNALISSVAVGALERLGGHGAADSLRGVVADLERDGALREQAERALERVGGES